MSYKKDQGYQLVRCEIIHCVGGLINIIRVMVFDVEGSFFADSLK